MATIDRRQTRDGKISYRARVRMRGYPARVRTFARLTDAKQWTAQTEADMKRGRAVPTADALRRTVADMIERYVEHTLPHKPRNKDYKKVAQLLRWWRAEIGTYALANVTPALIAECRDRLLHETTRRGANRSPSTVNRYLAAISHAFRTAVKEWYWVEQSPMASISKCPESPGRIRFLNDGERTRLLEACRASRNAYVYPIVVLALSTGARRGEILSLVWPQVDLPRAVITLHDTKNRDRRVLPLAGPALKLLEELSKVRRIDTNLLFPRDDGKAPTDITKAFNNAVERAGIQDFRFHDLRHSAASYLAMNGATVAELAEILGHRTLQMVRRYAHLTEAHTAKVVARMNESIFP